MTPLISIIIPNYNHARFLEQRLESVFEQTYKNFEVIILDDASSDDSRIILEKYMTHPKVSRVIFNEQNSGSAFAQWEKGIQMAKGDYIWIAESDDFCETNFLETLVPKFSYQENIGLVYCRSNNVDENNTFHDVFWPDDLDSTKWKSDHHNKGIDEIKNYLKFRNTIPNASACVFKKQNFDFSEIKTMFYAGDWLFWVKLLLKNDIYFCHQTLNHFRFHNKTTRTLDPTVKNYKKYSEYLKVLIFIYKNTKEKLSFERNHFWIYYEFQKQSISLSYLFFNLKPLFYPYLEFRYKLLKHTIRKNKLFIR